MDYRTQAAYNALKVIALTTEIEQFLKANDPNALAQVQEAIRVLEGK